MSAITTTRVHRIRELAAELDQLGKTALDKAAEAGRLLTECKAGLDHGAWLPWLESNFTFTDRTARRWMKLADDLATGKLKSDTVSNLTEAYRITTEPKPVDESAPFAMPLPHQKLVMLAPTGEYAAIEPMDETYVQVTWTVFGIEPGFSDHCLSTIEGTKRGIHRDHAWGFLVQCSSVGSRWKNAVHGYAPWTIKKTDTTKNPNLYGNPGSWIEPFMELEFLSQ
jgi:hypothetical protein